MKSHLQYFDFMPFTPYIVCVIKKQLWSDLSNKTSSKEFHVASYTDVLRGLSCVPASQICGAGTHDELLRMPAQGLVFNWWHLVFSIYE